MKALILACWFSCAECPPEAPFNAVLLWKQQLEYNREIKICCLENGKSRPMYFFKLSGFAGHQKIKCQPRDFFTYDEETIETDSNGRATVIAFVNPGKIVPDVIDMSLLVESNGIDFKVYTRDP